jgi:hypothetical protein
MRACKLSLGLLVTIVAVFAATHAAEAQIWKHIIPASYVEEVPQGRTELTQDDGPYLIMAATFAGEGAAEQAQQLVDELRTRHKLTAYIHDRKFDHANEKRPGRGIDQYGAPLRTRYQQEQIHEFAVLVGNFDSMEDPKGRDTLQRIKTLPSAVLSGDTPDSAMEEVRDFSNSVMNKVRGNGARGPMGGAFFTTNPLLPREFFVPKGVDDFIVKMNAGVENSLLNCQGKYTVQVATFRGKSVLQSGKAQPKETGGLGWMWGKSKENPLVEAAENAHLLTEALRKKGYDAYEFHDRMESIVTIGAFEQVGQRTQNGQLSPSPEVQRIIQTFGAAYDTPADPLTGDDIRKQKRAQELTQQVTQALQSHDAQVAKGMNPKHVKIMNGRKVARIIPIDIYPHAIEVPRKSVSSAYARQ